MSLAPADIAKRAAAARALEMVDDGMTLGLGTGSTAGWYVQLLSERIRSPGLDVVGVATSSATVWLAGELGVPLRKPDEVDRIDLVVDGADEIDPALDLIKGGGAALLQEKIVATSSDRMVVIADDTKYRVALGAFPLPVEIVRFGAPLTRRQAVAAVLRDMDVDGRRIVLRTGSSGPLVTDEGRCIVDLHLERIGDTAALAAALTAIPGVVETGLFIDVASSVILGRTDGSAEVLYRPGSEPAISSSRCATRTPDGWRILRFRPLRDRWRLRRGPGRPHRRGGRGARRPRRGIPLRRDLRHPRLRPEEAPRLRVVLPRRLRGRPRLWLDGRAAAL